MNGKKNFLGALKGISYDEYLSLKKTAEKVNAVRKENKNLIVERDEAYEWWTEHPRSAKRPPKYSYVYNGIAQAIYGKHSKQKRLQIS